MNCPICAGGMSRALELPSFPMTEMFEPYTDEYTKRGLIDQALLYCEPCSYAALEVIVPANELYAKDYRTKTSASVGASASVNGFYDFISRNTNVDNFSIFIDIGANDSSLLEMFRNPVGIAPARLVAIDPNASGDVDLIREYVERTDFSQFGHRPKMILCSHTLEHLEAPEALFAKLHANMRRDDVCAFQFPSLDCLVRDARIDQIHHQHLHYFSLRAISLLLAKCGFHIFAHEFDDSHYGTLRILFRSGLGEAMGENIFSFDIDRAKYDFDIQMAAFDAAVRRLRNPVCYGASLMFPVLAYYAPQIATIRTVCDEDASKHGMRWINANNRIIAPVDVKGRNTVVTAFNTKLAVRKIAAKLSQQGARNIAIPFNTL